MGHKVNPIGLRVGINRTWNSRWFADSRKYGDLLHEDFAIRKYLEEKLPEAAVSRVLIERPTKRCRVTIYSARPGMVYGEKWSKMEEIRKKLQTITAGEVSVNVVELRREELDAVLVSQDIARQLERRVSFRRAMKRAVQSAMRSGAEGIRVNCAGRLGGAEIARTEWYREGRVPLHTLRANIDYGEATAKTTYGTCGVKVWIFKGEIMAHDPMAQDRDPREHRAQDRPQDRRARG